MPYDLTVQNNDAAGSNMSIGAGTTRGSRFTPLTDMSVTAVYFKMSSTYQALVEAAIYDTVTQELVMAGPSVDITGKSTSSFTRFPLTNTAQLIGGREYFVAFYISFSNYNIGVSATKVGGTYAIDGYGFTISEAAVSMGQANGRAYPGTNNGFIYHLAAGFDIAVPSVPIFEPISGFTENAYNPLNFTYRINNPDNNAAKAVFTVGNLTVLTDNNPSHNISKVLNMQSQWESIAYGKNILDVTFTDMRGKIHVQKVNFNKLLGDELPLIDSVRALHEGLGGLKAKREDLASVLGVPMETSFDNLINTLKNENPWKKSASGEVALGYKDTPTGNLNVRGLDFTPSVILVKQKGGNGFAFSYTYIKTYHATTDANFIFGSSTSQLAYLTPTFYPDGFSIGIDITGNQSIFMTYFNAKTIEWLAIE